MVLPRVDLPQPLSPTSPKVSPGCTVKFTPSTALSQPTVRLGKPRVMGKCFIRPLTSSMAGIGGLCREEMTTHPVIGQDFQCRWPVLLTPWNNELTAGMKAAAMGWIDERRDHPRNPPHVTLLTLRQALQQFRGIGMRRMPKSRSCRGHFSFLPGIHHHYPVAELGDDSQIVGNQEHGGTLLLRQGLQQE